MIIPKTLEECYIELDNILEFNFFKLDKRSVITRYHHSLGQWIRNNWGLWTGESDLCKWFNNNEIKHPDDMSSIILTSYHRYKNNKDIKLEEQIEFYVEYWLDDDEKLKRRRKNKLNNLSE
jgi:hypothetical protein